MDHTEALRLQAAEKYVLGELQGDLRDAFESHYFGCSECALDLKAAAAFVDCSRQFYRAEAHAALVAARAAQPAPARPGFLTRFRWAVAAVPAFAALALLLVVVYQNSFTIPELESASHRVLRLPSADSRVLDLGASGTRRGGSAPANETPFLVSAAEPFVVTFDFTPSATFPAYAAQLQTVSGHALSQVVIPGDKAFQKFALAVPGGLLPVSGTYRVAILAADPATGNALPEKSVQTFTITVAFRQ